jgi:hypothetical protein
MNLWHLTTASGYHDWDQANMIIIRAETEQDARQFAKDSDFGCMSEGLNCLDPETVNCEQITESGEPGVVCEGC